MNKEEVKLTAPNGIFRFSNFANAKAFFLGQKEI